MPRVYVNNRGTVGLSAGITKGVGGFGVGSFLLIVFGWMFLEDKLDRMFTFTNGTNSITLNEYQQTYYPEGGTELLRGRGFETIDGKAVTWKVKVHSITKDGLLYWFLPEKDIYEQRQYDGSKRLIAAGYRNGTIWLGKTSNLAKSDEVVSVTFTPYNYGTSERFYIDGIDGYIN